MGRFCFWALASFCFVRKDLWDYIHLKDVSWSMDERRFGFGGVGSREREGETNGHFEGISAPVLYDDDVVVVVGFRLRSLVRC